MNAVVDTSSSDTVPHDPPSLSDVPSSPEQSFITPLSSPAGSREVDLPQESSAPQTSSKGKMTECPETSSPTREPTTADLTTLTPLRAHYLKKQLISLQFQRELDALIARPAHNVSPFSYLGPPFTPPRTDAPRLELPFLRYCFRRFVLSFPFLAAAPPDFFPDKLQPFMASMLSKNLSSSSAALDEKSEDAEETARNKLLTKLERNASMLMTSGVKIVEKEEVVRLSQADLDRLEAIARKRAARERRMKDRFEVNVICVRTVTEKGRVRSRVHEEFIVRTRRGHQPDVYVSRRYGDFKTLAAELRKAHPGESIPAPPAKDRTIVSLSTMTSPVGTQIPGTSRPGSPRGAIYATGRNTSGDSFSSQSTTSPISPTMPMLGVGGPTYTGGASRLAREKNRLTLRAYLHSLLASPELASSPVLRSFLLSGPTQLTAEEMEDAIRREEADKLREDGRKRFAREIAARVDGLREAARSVKGELFAKNGLTHIFATIKETEDIRQLPSNYQAVIEWARISLASTVFQHFVAADTASESFASLKRIHGLMPYFMLKTILKISNPMAMIRGVLDLFLAHPFGGRSLLQRMFTGSLVEEAKAIEEDIQSVKDKVEDPVICEKVRQFVYAPREIQSIFKADAAEENIHVLVAVLRSGEEPALSRGQLQRVMRAHRAHKEYVKSQESLQDSDDDEGPQDEEAWLFEDLSVLTKLYSRLRDREQLIELIFEGTTADLLKDIITIFYAPLAQVYRAASIADSLGDLQNFMNDLTRTVESVEELSQQDPAKTVQIFIDLIKRHEQAFYSFVHKVHSKGEGLFSNLMQWIELFLTLMRDGLGDRISLEFLLPHTGKEREDILREVDEIALYHYKLKVTYEDRVRRRFGRTQGLNDADAEDEIAAQMVDGVVKDLSFGDLIQGDAEDLAAEETDSEDDSSGDDYSSEDEDSESDESSSEESSETDLTERENTPHPGNSPTSVKRSHTIAHSPHASRPPPLPPKQASHKQSLDLPQDRPPVKLRHSRSLTAAHPGAPPLPPKDHIPKSAPPVPPKHHASKQSPFPVPRASRSPSRVRAQSQPPSKRKKAPALKPPELKHLPHLLPILVELMRHQLRA